MDERDSGRYKHRNRLRSLEVVASTSITDFSVDVPKIESLKQANCVLLMFLLRTSTAIHQIDITVSI